MRVTVTGIYSGTSKTSGKAYRRVYYTEERAGVEGLATDSTLIFDNSVVLILGNDYDLIFPKNSDIPSGVIAL